MPRDWVRRFGLEVAKQLIAPWRRDSFGSTLESSRYFLIDNKIGNFMSAMHVSFVVFCHSELAFPEARVVQAGAWLLRCREDPNRPSYNQTGKKPPL